MGLRIATNEVCYPGFVLQIPAMILEPGIYHVRGGNGSGKTTFFQYLLGMLDAPNIPSDPDLCNARKGYVPQAFREALLPWLNVEQNLRLFSDSPNDPKALLDQLKFAQSDLRKRVFSLSGGQAQRLILARELAAEPDLLILDEPFSALDKGTVEFLMGFLLSSRTPGQVMLVASHIDFYSGSGTDAPRILNVARETDERASVCLA